MPPRPARTRYVGRISIPFGYDVHTYIIYKQCMFGWKESRVSWVRSHWELNTSLEDKFVMTDEWEQFGKTNLFSLWKPFLEYIYHVTYPKQFQQISNTIHQLLGGLNTE